MPPRKLSELKEFVPKSSMQNIREDPAQNSVLGNVKKLSDLLGEYPNPNWAVNNLRERLGDILDASEGRKAEELGDDTIKFLHASLHTLYLMNSEGNRSAIQDEQKRKDMRNLLEYVAAGLGVDEEFEVSEEQKRSIAEREKQGRKAVEVERAEEERQARWNAVAGKTGLNVLDEHKSAVDKLPRKFSGADARAKEAEARRQLEALCIDIMATRRTVDAERNQKGKLEKSSVDPDLLEINKGDLSRCGTLNEFFKSMSYSDLRSLAASGHGGAMEEKFADYIKNEVAEIPGDVPPMYMPTARQRTEALQQKLMSNTFHHQTPPGEQRKLYAELLATRAAVNSKRGQKSSLEKPLSAEILDQERRKFYEEPLKTALARATAMGEKQEDAYWAARDGHGGALEDLVRAEIRKMAMEKEQGCRLTEVDPRFAPTCAQRHSDLTRLIASGRLKDSDRLRATIEAGMLADRMSRGEGEERLDNIESLNRRVDEQAAIYAKVMDGRSLNAFTADVLERGLEAGSGKFEIAHAGELRAIRLNDKLNSELEAKPSRDDLMKLAAKKMLLFQHKVEFQKNKDTDALATALEDVNLNREVEKMVSRWEFRDFCDTLGPDKLAAQAKGSGEQLVLGYAQTLKEFRHGPKPEDKAPAKVGEKVEEKAKEEEAVQSLTV